MNAREFGKYLERDYYACAHCGLDDETLVPNHRAGRGMGSVKSRNRPSNIITICSYYNQLIESNADAAQEALARGWRLASWQDPLMVPVWYAHRNRWMFLDDNFGSAEALDWDV
jgi:hypothetical protein